MTAYSGTHSAGDICFCDSSELPRFGWSDADERRRNYFKALLTMPSTEFVSNVSTRCLLVRIGDHVMPMTVNEAEYENSWVCSPYNAAIIYPLEELKLIPGRVLRAGLASLIHSVAPILKAGQINKVVCFNNWMLSTCLYPAWEGAGLEALTVEAVRRWPQHAIMFRSLNPVCNGPLLKKLTDAGYLLAPSRQVYLCSDFEAAARRQNSEIDWKLLTRRTDYRVVRDTELTDADLPRIRNLYDQLYLQKYSMQNPRFTEELLRLWHQTGVLKLIGLRSPSGSLDGIAGCFAIHNVVTTPVLGYDLELPQKLGLYRLLSALIFQEARDSGRILNLSSGAAQFKRHRGGEPQLEYSAVYVQHLPLFRRAVWSSLATLLARVGAPILQKYEL